MDANGAAEDRAGNQKVAVPRPQLLSDSYAPRFQSAHVCMTTPIGPDIDCTRIIMRALEKCCRMAQASMCFLQESRSEAQGPQEWEMFEDIPLSMQPSPIIRILNIPGEPTLHARDLSASPELDLQLPPPGIVPLDLYCPRKHAFTLAGQS